MIRGAITGETKERIDDASARVTRRRVAGAMELVSNALVYVGGYVFLVFMAVCLATGACVAWYIPCRGKGDER